MTFEGIKELIDQVGRAARVESVFGESREIAGRTVIPVARVCYGGGGGGGEGKAEESKQQGCGGGGGLGVGVRPVGFLVVTEEAERWVPVLDVTRLAMAGAMVAGMALWTIKKIATRRRD